MYYGDIPLQSESQIYDWFQGGNELLTLSFANDLSYGELFAEQFERFKIPLTQKLGEELLNICANIVEYVIGYMEPYSFFWDTTDVVLTDEWREYCFQLEDYHRPNIGYELDPERLETFRYVPGKDEEFFREALAYPGLEALPFDLGEHILVAIDERCYDYTPDSLSSCAREELEALCLITDCDGVHFIDSNKMKTYFQLGCWVAIIWAFGPLGKKWRGDAHEIFNACYNEGACIIYDGMIYDRSSYIQLERAAKSCYICGVSAWCVELTQDADVVRYICESCLSSGLGLRSERGCGTKFCHHVACPNHPAHTLEKGGYWMSVRGKGQLAGLAAGARENRILGKNQSTKLLTSN